MTDFIINFFESLGYVYFISHYIHTNHKYKPIHTYVVFTASVAILTASSFFTEIDQISLFVINAIAFLICWQCSDNSLIEIIFLLFYVETLIIISNILALFLSCIILHSRISIIFSSPQLLFMTSLFSKLLFCLLSFFSIKIIKKRNYAFSKSMLILVFIISISFLTLAYSFTRLITNHFNQYTIIILLIILSILLILNYVLFHVLKEENYNQMMKTIQLAELENMKFYIEATKSISDENTKLKHYLDNVLLILKKEKQNQEIKNLCFKLENLESNIHFIETENNIMNNIFNTIMLIYKEKHIQWNLYLESNLLEIESLDLAIIIDSLLKLAIENINSNEEVIFKTKERSKFYYLSLSFHYQKKLDTESYYILLENIIKKYSGEMTIKTSHNQLFCDIILKK